MKYLPHPPSRGFTIACALALAAGPFATTPAAAEPAPPPAPPMETFSPEVHVSPFAPSPKADPLASDPDFRTLDAPVATWRERAENLDLVSLDVTPGYDVLQSIIHVLGGSAFHLAHPEGTTGTEIIELDPVFVAESDTRLFFESRLGWATQDQVASVRISTDDGVSWSNLWSRAGTGDSGQGTFVLEIVDLSEYEGQEYKLRFIYEAAGGYFQGADPGLGWYIDDIQIGTEFETRLYSIGEPTDEEQLYLEFINRARADAMEEAWRLRETDDPDVIDAMEFFDVDKDLLIEQFEELAPTAQPLAFNAALIDAARIHSQDMFENVFQGHSSSDNPPTPNEPGDGPGDRVSRQGYAWQNVGENVFAWAESVWYGHAGFNIDWGEGADGSVGGMQDPPGHRLAIHNPDYREIGVGVVEGTNSDNGETVGPMLVTQNFAVPQGGGGPILTGVVWYDAGQTGFYSLGDGIGGVTVTVDGVSYHAITSSSGGYAIPLPGNGEYEVTFEGAGYITETVPVAVSNEENVKLDFEPLFLRLAGTHYNRADETFSIDVEAPAGVDLVLETSTDLIDWSVMEDEEAVALDSGGYRFEPPAQNSRRFYRVLLEE